MSHLVARPIGKRRRDGTEFQEREASGAVPSVLRHFEPNQMAALRLWVDEDDSKQHKRESLLKIAMKKIDGFRLEDGDLLVEHLLQDGWVICTEIRKPKRDWQWVSLAWRDLTKLQSLLGVSGTLGRQQQRQTHLSQAKEQLIARLDSFAQGDTDPYLNDELAQAIEELEKAKSLTPDALKRRLDLMFQVAHWRDSGQQGMRQDFALSVRDGTKAIEANEWKWLDTVFDLERLGISRFAQTAWLAGEVELCWSNRKMELSAVHFLGIPLKDMQHLERLEGVQQWWLIENRTSFERNARKLPHGTLLLWMPGRPSLGWQAMMAHLLTKAPCPAWISADADPAGVDIACAVGRLWEQAGLTWEAHQMSSVELTQTKQKWDLTPRDRLLLQNLLAREALPATLRTLCETMQREDRKAEQEAWL